MAPPRPPPELIDDAVAEILLRIAPDEPQHLFRASLVCKLWQRLLTDAAFLRRYRRFHGTPPLLGFFLKSDDGSTAPRFIPTTSSSPFPQPVLDCGPWIPLDYRHGRVLLQKGRNYIVWDPIRGDLEELPEPDMPFQYVSVTVLCAAAGSGCDHRDCHGGPFLVVWVGTDLLFSLVYARVYSSRVGSWGSVVSVQVGSDAISPSRSALVGHQICFLLQIGARILKYDLDKHNSTVIDPPEPYWHDIFLVPTEDGLLGIATIRDCNLYLWSRKVNAEGVEAWMQYRVMELQTMLPPLDNPFKHAAVVGFAGGVRVVIMSTNDDVFTIDLTSGRVRKVSEPGIYHDVVVPFMSFYTPDCSCGKLPLPADKLITAKS